MAELLYQGHGSFRITAKDGTTVYVDPFAGEGYDRPADIILVTHDHYDHNQVNKPARKPGTAVITQKDALKHQNGQLSYGTFSVKGIEIMAVPAANSHHDVNSCVGYVLTVDGVRVYAAGDTSRTPEMETLLPGLSLDWCLLPTDGIYNMGPEEAAVCAELIGARFSVPIHAKPGALWDRIQAERFHAKNRILVEPGTVINL